MDADKGTNRPNSAIIEVQHQDDDKHSLNSQDQLLTNTGDRNGNEKVMENNNDGATDKRSEEKKEKESVSTITSDEGVIVEKKKKKVKKSGSEIELKNLNEGNDEEEMEGISRKNSRKGSKKRKKKNSVEDLTLAAVVDNSIVHVPIEDHLKDKTITNGKSGDAFEEKEKETGEKTKDENKNEKQNKENENKNDEQKKDNENSDKKDPTKSNDEIAVLGSDDLDGYTKVKGDEELDALSTFSYKETKDFKYYFQHPYLRLFIAYFVTFCNFLIYAEDPVAHSLKECNIPLVGNDFTFVCMRYPSNAWSLLKVVLWIAAIIVGLLIGKLVVHNLLLSKLFRLKMFYEDQGSWMVMFLASLISLFIFSWLYNAFLLAGGSSTESYRLSGLMGLTNSIFMKMAACGTWCGDFFTAWMVTDMMLQEKLYPYWGRPVRRWWNRKYNRIILFWVVTSLTSFTVVFTIATDYIQWDTLHRDFLSSNEVSRAFLASFILVMDILIVVQDWDFPHFMSAIDIKLPGVNTAHIKFDIPKCFRPEKWQIHITGKWFNYGILFLVMILDLNMWKNQIFYAPYDYGQYVDSDGKIHTVKDDYSLENHNETLMSFSYRNSTINPETNQTYISDDTVMNSRYYNYSLGVKAIAFIPALAAFITLGMLVWIFGRFKPSKEDPYAGRLLKRPRGQKKSSFKLFRDSIRRRFTLTKRLQSVPKLLAFTRRNRSNNQSDLPENWRPPTEPA